MSPTINHTHDCTGPDLTCPCGYKLVIPRYCVSFEVIDGAKTLVSDGFNCDSLLTAAEAFQRAADKLRRLR